MIDLLVAGGGPVGLATALYAHRAGLTVQVLEPRAAPIDKACGEGLMPAAAGALADLGVHPPGQPFRGIRYVAGGRRVEARFRGAPGLAVRRTALQTALLERVHAVGIEVLAAASDDLVQDSRSVQTAGVRARYLAAADGLHSPLRRRCGLEVARSDTRPARFGLRRHYRLAPWTDLVEVHWAREAEAYVTPVGPDTVGIAVLSSARRPFAEHLQAFPELSDRLAGRQGTGVRGAGPLRQRSRCRVAGRVLLVGDAAGYVDALTGEGIAIGLAAAQRLVSCVAADDPQSYERAWRSASRRYRALTEGLVWAAERPVLRRAIVPAACGLPPVFGYLVRQLAA